LVLISSFAYLPHTNSFCFGSHIPLNSDIILIELAINDEPLEEHTENMENLLRSLLDLPNKPAVVMVEALGLGGGSMRYGGDVHMPVAVYYGELGWSLRVTEGFSEIERPRPADDVGNGCMQMSL
jgi:hypothetical protein